MKTDTTYQLEKEFFRLIKLAQESEDDVKMDVKKELALWHKVIYYTESPFPDEPIIQALNNAEEVLGKLFQKLINFNKKTKEEEKQDKKDKEEEGKKVDESGKEEKELPKNEGDKTEELKATAETLSLVFNNKPNKIIKFCKKFEKLSEDDKKRFLRKTAAGKKIFAKYNQASFVKTAGVLSTAEKMLLRNIPLVGEVYEFAMIIIKFAVILYQAFKLLAGKLPKSIPASDLLKPKKLLLMVKEFDDSPEKLMDIAKVSTYMIAFYKNCMSIIGNSIELVKDTFISLIEIITAIGVLGGWFTGPVGGAAATVIGAIGALGIENSKIYLGTAIALIEEFFIQLTTSDYQAVIKDITNIANDNIRRLS